LLTDGLNQLDISIEEAKKAFLLFGLDINLPADVEAHLDVIGIIIAVFN